MARHSSGGSTLALGDAADPTISSPGADSVQTYMSYRVACILLWSCRQVLVNACPGGLRLDDRYVVVAKVDQVG